MKSIRVEEFFIAIDYILDLKKVPIILFLAVSAIFIFTISITLLIKSASLTVSERSNVVKKSRAVNKLSAPIILKSLFILSLASVFIGLVNSLMYLTISLIFTIGLCLYVVTLSMNLIINYGNGGRADTILFYILSMLVLFFFSSKVLLNGIYASETTTDTLEIFYKGFFRFSRHAGWYDLAPVDGILCNFLIRITGQSDPLGPFVPTITYFSLSLSFTLMLLSLVKNINYDGFTLNKYALAILLLVACPYTAVINITATPTNYGLATAVLAIMLVVKRRFGMYMTSCDAIAFTLLAASASLAHPKALIAILYLLALVVAYAIMKSTKALIKVIFLALTSILVYTLKTIYTATLYGSTVLIRSVLEGFSHLITFYSSEVVKLEVFPGGPPPPKSSLFSFGAFFGFLSAIFFVEILKLLRRRKEIVDLITVLVVGTSLILSFAGAVSNFIGPNSRYLAIPGATLGSLQAVIYITKIVMRSKGIAVYGLYAMIGLMSLSSILSPNAMIEEYNIFTGGRWPRVENFLMSSILMNYIDKDYVIDVFNKLRTPSLCIYLSNDILLFGHPYHHIEVLIVQELLIPGVINTKSYWDFYGGKHFIKCVYYVNLTRIANENLALNGWRWIATWN